MALEEQIPWLARASRGARYLIGVSGGADSVALLHLLVGAGFRNLRVCHLDHRLRGRDSTADARFVGRLAAQLGLVCEIGRIDVGKRMVERGEPLETAARQARHEFFAGCAAKFRCRRILLAHHADDQAETVLWNLLRGSYGLRGMREEQRIAVGARAELLMVRPLLEVRHAGLVDWLQARGLGWREDASNQAPVAIRNRLRHEILPRLAEISGRDAVMALARGAADALERELHENDLLEQARVMDPQGRLHLPALRALAPVLQRAALRQYLRAQGVGSIDRALLERAIRLLDPTRAAVVNLPGGRLLRRRGGRIWIAD